MLNQQRKITRAASLFTLHTFTGPLFFCPSTKTILSQHMECVCSNGWTDMMMNRQEAIKMIVRKITKEILGSIVFTATHWIDNNCPQMERTAATVASTSLLLLITLIPVRTDDLPQNHLSQPTHVFLFIHKTPITPLFLLFCRFQFWHIIYTLQPFWAVQQHCTASCKLQYHARI